jgi:DNA-binding beta-propeller fold protein YncE
VAAGTDCYGARSNQLQYPCGIFVDRNLNLYVADCGNDRVQLFFSGQVTATTVAGNGAPNTISLNCPTDVLLDADGYLFIADGSNHRIIGSGPNGFRCLVSCSGPGAASNELNNPTSFSFDTYGNIFVVDRDNNRIQKFNLMPNTNSSSESLRALMNIHCLLSLLQVVHSINLCFVHQRRGIPTELHSPMQVSLACRRVVFS